MAKPTPLAQKETSLSAQIADYLKSRRIYNDRLQCGKVETKRGNWVQMCKAGTPDRFAIVRGHIIFIEVKKFGKEPTAEQFDRHKELRASGAIVIVADSFDNFTNQFSAIRAAIEEMARKGELYD